MKRHRLAIVLIVLLTTSSLPAAAGVTPSMDRVGAADGTPTVTLTVRVTDNLNSGISDAKLTATWDGGSTTARTAGNGKAFVDVEKGARVEIAVKHSAYTRNNPVVVEDAQQDDVHIVVSRKADATVTVTDEGTPVSDARVTLHKQGQSRAASRGRTDGNGVFQSGTVEQGNYRIVAVKEGYLVNETTLEVRGSTETTIDVEEDTVNVEFTVVDDHFDEPRAVEGATVQVEGVTTASLSTSGTGTATIGLPVNAEYTLTVTKDGYTSTKRTVQVAEEEKPVSVTISKEPTLSLEAVNKKVVVGEKVQVTVSDEYGERAAAATILVDGEAVGETDGDGVYRVTIDSSGEHTITAEKGDVSSDGLVVEGVMAGGDTDPASSETTGATEVSLPDFGQPTFVMKAGVAAAGVLFAFLVVRRLL